MMPGSESLQNRLPSLLPSFFYSVELQLIRRSSKIAEQMAESAPAERSILVDAFAGAGGNTIAFARSGRWKRIYAIEKDPAVLRCAKHNAKVYGVQDKITWFEGSCFDILKNQLKDLAPYSVIFASPPWGGMSSFSFERLLYLTDRMQARAIATIRSSTYVLWNRTHWLPCTRSTLLSRNTWSCTSHGHLIYGNWQRWSRMARR